MSETVNVLKSVNVRVAVTHSSMIAPLATEVVFSQTINQMYQLYMFPMLKIMFISII